MFEFSIEQYEEAEEKIMKQYVGTLNNFLLKDDEVVRR